MILTECDHDWPITRWGILIGVAVCRKCGKVAKEEDFASVRGIDEEEEGAAQVAGGEP